MAQKRLSVPSVREVLRLKYELGRSHRQIAAALGIGHSTVGAYVRRAKAAGVSWSLAEKMDDAALEAALVRPRRPSRVARPEPDWADVHRDLRTHKGTTLHLLWDYYLEWHMRKALAPLLFEDDDPQGARAKRDTPVQKAEPSDSAKRKTASKTTPEGLPVQSMTDLLSHLGSLTLNEVHLRGQPNTRFMVTSEPTELQARAFALLDLPPEPRVYNRLTV